MEAGHENLGASPHPTRSCRLVLACCSPSGATLAKASRRLDLPKARGFPAQLKHRLLADGYNVVVWNGSNPGDTSSDGYARINEALQPNPDLVLVEFGGNDMLDRVDPRVTYRYLDDRRLVGGE